MTRTTYFITLMLALILAVLTLLETWVYKKWDDAATQQRDNQLKLAYSQSMRGFTEQFLRRLAIDSQRDPALAEMLKKDKVKVVVAAPGQPAEATHAEALSGTSTAPGAANQGAPSVASPASTPASQP